MTKTKNTVGYIIIIALLSAAGVISLNLYFHERTAHDYLDIRTFPYKFGAWKGRDLKITERDYEILETRNLISRAYINHEKERLFLFIIYSETNRAVFHPPEVCIVGSGASIVNKIPEKITMGAKIFTVNKLYVEKNNAKEIVLYCYSAGNLYTDNFYLQQVYFALNQLFGKHKGGATIRVSMPIINGEEKTLAKLKSFMSEAIKILEASNR